MGGRIRFGCRFQIVWRIWLERRGWIEVVLQSLDVHRVDGHGFDGGQGDRFRPGDGVRRDGPVDQVLGGKLALI